MPLTLTSATFCLSQGWASGQFLYEGSLNATPLDVEVTPNGAVAIVRGTTTTSTALGSDQRVSFWRTDSATSPKIIPSATNAVGRGNLTTSGALATFSNAISAVNDRAVVIGSRDTTADGFEDTTYVDIVAIDPSVTPPTITVLATHALGGGSNVNTRAGLAHDVAITPDGTLAVVTHRNWIHVFELATGSIIAALDVGGPDSPAAAGPCDPGGSRNSLEVTNDRAIVTMARTTNLTTGWRRIWTYIVDLDYRPPTSFPTLLLEHATMHDSGDSDLSPHDLAITPDGSLGAVTANRVYGLYDLTAGSFVDGRLDSSLYRTVTGFTTVWDSIELSNDRAVVLGNQFAASNYYWTAQVLSVSTGSTTLLATFGTSTGNPPARTGWDMTLSDDGRMAAIKGWNLDAAILDVDAAAPATLWESPASSGGTALLAPQGDVLMNDAVVLTRPYAGPVIPPATNGLHRWAAYAGFEFLSGGAYGKTRVHFYDLAQYDPLTGLVPPPTTFVLEDPTYITRPVDLSLAGPGTEVLLRNTAPPDDPGSASGRDWYHFTSRTPALVGTGIGGSGTCVGRDNLRYVRGVSVSISRAPSANSGYIHVLQTL